MCFGYPVAYEDARRCAARTGLAILADAKAVEEQLRREHNLELNPWVCLHTGPAVVEAGKGGLSIVGEARNVAVRLEDAAAPGQIICSEATHRLIQGQFTCARLSRQKLKGVAQPLELFHVQGVDEARNPIDAVAPAGLTPLTGRDHEISLLKERWEQAQEGMGQVVLLIGEPGLGKSRLVHTLKEHVLGQMVEGEVDAPVIELRCTPHFQNTSLHPAIDFFERALGIGREEPPQDRFDRLLHRLEQYGLRGRKPCRCGRRCCRYRPRSASPALVARDPAEGRNVQDHTGLAAHVRADAGPVRRRGLALGRRLHPGVPRDVHRRGVARFDPDRAHLPPRVQDTLARGRPSDEPGPEPAHARQVGDLMRQKTGATVLQSLVEQVYDRTSGVPLFVEEFTRMVQESGLNQAGESGTGTGTVLARRDPRHAPGPDHGPPGSDGK